jgi:hypothetical protein
MLNDALLDIWKGAVITKVKVLFHSVIGMTEENLNQNNWLLGRQSI